MTKMNNALYNFVAETLREYPFYDDEIAAIDYELRNPTHETDDNIGGGRGNLVMTDEPVISMMSKIESDRTIGNIKHNKIIIDKALYQTDDKTRSVIMKLYCSKGATSNTLASVAADLDIDFTTVSRKRSKFFQTIAESLRPVDRF